MIIIQQHYLFSYGTLQLERVQIETYGRKLIGQADRLRHYKVDQLQITDPEVLATSGKEFHPIAIKTNLAQDFIEGTIFEITEEELHASDQYEVSDYQRILETFESGTQAWIYVKRNS